MMERCYGDIRGDVLQCVAVCCSVLQSVAVCCSVLQCVAVCCSVLQCVAVRGSKIVLSNRARSLVEVVKAACERELLNN